MVWCYGDGDGVAMSKWSYEVWEGKYVQGFCGAVYVREAGGATWIDQYYRTARQEDTTALCVDRIREQQAEERQSVGLRGVSVRVRDR